MFMELLLNVFKVSDDCLFNSIEFWLFVRSFLLCGVTDCCILFLCIFIFPLI